MEAGRHGVPYHPPIMCCAIRHTIIWRCRARPERSPEARGAWRSRRWRGGGTGEPARPHPRRRVPTQVHEARRAASRQCVVWEGHPVVTVNRKTLPVHSTHPATDTAHARLQHATVGRGWCCKVGRGAIPSTTLPRCVCHQLPWFIGTGGGQGPDNQHHSRQAQGVCRHNGQFNEISL